MTTSAGKTILYSFWTSSCSWRVRIALNFKEIPYETKTINLLAFEHDASDFQEINPMKKVPALFIDGHCLIESFNIMQYLEETRPFKPLMPTDPFKRAQVRQLCEIVVSGIQPLQNLGVLRYLESTDKLNWAQNWITRGFEGLEKLLNSSAGKYCVGDEITLADCCLVPQVFNARKYDVDLSKFPLILKIDKQLENHPAFVSTHPNNQPDCTNRTRL